MSSNISSSLPQTPFPATPVGPLPQPPGSTSTNVQQPVKVYTLNEDQWWDNQGTGCVPQLRGAAQGHVPASWSLKTVAHWRRMQTASGFALRTPRAAGKEQDVALKEELPGVVGVQYATVEGREVAPERVRRLSQSGAAPSCGCVWWWK